jgi:hypothetical protein
MKQKVYLSRLDLEISLIDLLMVFPYPSLKKFCFAYLGLKNLSGSVQRAKSYYIDKIVKGIDGGQITFRDFLDFCYRSGNEFMDITSFKRLYPQLRLACSCLHNYSFQELYKEFEKCSH